ncbi:MAG: hypothetical protein JXR78_04785 [Victivallales bacterium]|nr:hypothetical protein [Victivallales bacterium]
MRIRAYKVAQVATMTLTAVLTSVLVSSCGWFSGDISDEEVEELHKDMRAQKRETVFDSSLRSLGHLLLAYYVPPTAIQSKNIGNQTGEKNLPSDLYIMISSSLNKIGPQITFIPFDAQYIVAESSTGGTISRIYPQVVISGGITGFDKEMFEKEREVEAAGGWAGAQAGGHIKASGGYSRVSLDLNMLDYKTQAYFPGVMASNSIALQKDSLGWGIYGYYMGNGAAFDYDLKRKQGVHAALRTLVEFSLLQLLGKQFDVPYWRTISGANPDPDLIELVREKFLVKSEDDQHLIIKKFLFLHGYNGLDLNSPVFKGNEESALKEALRIHKSANITELYMALWEKVPLDSAARRVRIARRREIKDARKRAEQEKRLEAERAAAEKEAQVAAQKQHEQNVEKYNAAIQVADRLFHEAKYQQAHVKYSEALDLFGGEAHPRQMLERINALQAQAKAAEDHYRKLKADADGLFRQAESNNFNYSSYKKALDAYVAASKYKPDDAFVKARIGKIRETLSKYSTVFQTEGEDKW